MHLVMGNCLGGLSLPRNGVRVTDRSDMTIAVYRGRKTTTHNNHLSTGPTSGSA